MYIFSSSNKPGSWKGQTWVDKLYFLPLSWYKVSSAKHCNITQYFNPHTLMRVLAWFLSHYILSYLSRIFTRILVDSSVIQWGQMRTRNSIYRAEIHPLKFKIVCLLFPLGQYKMCVLIGPLYCLVNNTNCVLSPEGRELQIYKIGWKYTVSNYTFI